MTNYPLPLKEFPCSTIGDLKTLIAYLPDEWEILICDKDCLNHNVDVLDLYWDKAITLNVKLED